MNGPCTWPVRSLYTAVDCRIHRPQTRACTRYTAAYTGPKHGRVQGTRPCTRPCSGNGRTMHGPVHGTYTAVHTGRPCPEHGRVRSRYVAKHGRVRGPYPTVYVPYTWPCMGHRVHGRLHGRLYGPCVRRCIWPCTLPFTASMDRVHRRATAVYIVRPRQCLVPVLPKAG